MTSRPIQELIAESSSPDDLIAGPAGLQLLRRSEECRPYVSELLRNLQRNNAALAEYAYLTLADLIDVAMPQIEAELSGATGAYRKYLLGLASICSDFRTAYRILKDELDNGNEASRNWAANLLGRRFEPGDDWGPDASGTLNHCIEMLLATQCEPDAHQYWSDAYITLKHLGVITSRDA